MMLCKSPRWEPDQVFPWQVWPQLWDKTPEPEGMVLQVPSVAMGTWCLSASLSTLTKRARLG